ncbi:hypothetical protein CH63R_03765 [Colletotrichum higginsianum IMI 349063]|uniref:Uncharacterized protein n=1 Tax=Colletotrichum higginsianum (strain IMI 349063) TaxID=759273 RepID=A0A1B7YHC6_COLHI|nr:hypothetical protein CH63R_03765 [Colletotrichum higginsianum IMI 349063]OBR11469.1 hypothetical protein CH63R_03765 [Colletotrichum higginsianum IMI 349063]
MHTALTILLSVLLPLVLAAPHISPRENGCEIGATPVPSVTYTVMAPVRTIIIDMTQEDGCPWLVDGSRPTIAPPAASPGPSSNPESNPPGRILLDPSSDGQNRDPAPTASPDGGVPGGPGGGGGGAQPNQSPAEVSRPTGARSGRIPLDGNFGQGIPTGPISPSANANAPTSAVPTRTSLPPKSTGDRFVIFAGSSSKTFSVPSIRQGPVVIGLLAFWVFVVMVP